MSDVEKTQHDQADMTPMNDSKCKAPQKITSLLDDDVFVAKLPTLAPEIASYLLNEGIYNFMHLKAGGESDFEDPEAEVHQLMDKIITKKTSYIQTSYRRSAI